MGQLVDGLTLRAWAEPFITGMLVVSFLLALSFVIRYLGHSWRTWEEGRHIMGMSVTIAWMLGWVIALRLWPDSTEPLWLRPLCLLLGFGALAWQLVWRHTLLPMKEPYASWAARLRRRRPQRPREVLTMSENPTPARRSFWGRVADAWRWFRRQEPARVQAYWRAIVGVLAAGGLIVSDTVDGRVTAVITAVFVVLTISQGEQTRNRVIPQDKVPAGTVLTDGAEVVPAGAGQHAVVPPR